MTRRRRKPRVLMLIENHAYSVDARCPLHAEALAAAGYEVTAVSPRRKGEGWAETVRGVRVVHYPKIPKFLAAFGYAGEYGYSTLIMSLLTAWITLVRRPDIVTTANPPDILFIPCLPAMLAGALFVHDLRDHSPELYLAKYGDGRKGDVLYRALVWLERRACRLADHVITTNESSRELVMTRHKLPAGRVTVIRCGPDLRAVGPREPDPRLRARAGTVIGYLGTMSRQDGVDHLLRALRELDTRYGRKDWYCILVGSAEDLASLKDLAVRLGIADRVEFTGRLPAERWTVVLSTSDLCVEPAPENAVNPISTMLKLMDYMAMAKPFVAYDLREHRVTAGEAGLFARPNEPADLARLIDHLIAHPDLRANLGAAGRKRMEDSLAWPFQRERLLALYSRLGGGRLRPAEGVQE